MSAFIDLLLFGLWCFFEEIAAQRGTKHICNSPWKFLIAGSWVWGGHITHTHTCMKLDTSSTENLSDSCSQATLFGLLFGALELHASAANTSWPNRSAV